MVCAVLVLFIALFKVGNTDFWWHIKAGQILRDTGWISLDPFTYTRLGQPYLAHHEWLAQVFLSLIFDVSGVVGITVFRMLIMLTVFTVPLLLHKKNMWCNAVLAVLAATGARPAFTDRPQLFSFVFFSIIVSLCIVYLEAPEKTRQRILMYLPVAIIVWSNLHGAASLTGIAVIGALVVQRMVSGALNTKEWKWLVGCLTLLFVAPMVSPSGVGNLTYAFSLLTDQTAQLIAEWQPAALGMYLQHTAVLWVVSLVAMTTTRRSIIFSTLVLLGMGYLSRSAVRHEALFLISALALTVYQLRYNDHWNTLLSTFYRNQKLYVGVMAAVLITLGVYTHVRAYDVNRVDHLFGIGLHEPIKGAYEFLERQSITGPMFNNYNAGGELLYRGYPDRKVFIDGRNIDYGYDFMNKAIVAGLDTTVWTELEQEHKFTHAVIYYDVQADGEVIPYTDVLDEARGWSLVYLDDYAAVYVKDRPDISPITLINPYMLHHQVMPEAMTNEQFNALQSELNFMIDSRPDSIKPRLYLARLYMLIGAFEPSEVLLQKALIHQPNNYRIYISMAQLHMEKEEWPQALYYLKKAKRKAGFTGVQLNDDLIKTVEERARS